MIVNHFIYLTGTAISPSEPSSTVTDGQVNRAEGIIEFILEGSIKKGEIDSDWRIWVENDKDLDLDVKPKP